MSAYSTPNPGGLVPPGGEIQDLAVGGTRMG
jgi:hypothetical protein